MDFRRVKRLAQRMLGQFHERHLYVRSGSEVHGFVLTPVQQLTVLRQHAPAGRLCNGLRLRHLIVGWLRLELFSGQPSAVPGNRLAHAFLK